MSDQKNPFAWPAITPATTGPDLVRQLNQGLRKLTAANLFLQAITVAPPPVTQPANLPTQRWTQTWNTAVAQTALLLNVTDTSSPAASLLLDLQVGGVSKFSVRKDGTVFISLPVGFTSLTINPGPLIVGTDPGGAAKVRIGGSLQLPNNNSISFYNAAATVPSQGAIFVDTSDRLAFFENGAVRMLLDTAGALIVGTDPGGAELVRAASARFTSLTVTGNATLGGLFLSLGGVNVLTMSNNGGNASLEHGRVDGVASTPFIDFHSGATAVDYDVRIIASGGTGANGGGALAIQGAVTITNGLGVTAGNIGVGAGPAAGAGVRVTNSPLSTAFQDAFYVSHTVTSAATNRGTAMTIAMATQAAAFSTNIYGIQMVDTVKGAGSTINTQYGMWLGDLTSGTTNYAFYSGLGIVRHGDELRLDHASNAHHEFYIGGARKAGISVIAADSFRFTDSGGTVKLQLGMGGNDVVFTNSVTDGIMDFVTNVSVPGGFGNVGQFRFNNNVMLTNANDIELLIETTGASDPPSIHFNRKTSGGAVGSGDYLGAEAYFGWDGTAYTQRGAVSARVDGAVSAGVVPTSLILATGGASMLERIVLTSAGDFTPVAVGRVPNFGTSALPWGAAQFGGNVTLSNPAGIAAIIEVDSATLVPSVHFHRRNAGGAVASGDYLGADAFYGWDGGAYISRASVSSRVDGAVSSGTVPSSLILASGGASLLERLVLTSGGDFTPVAAGRVPNFGTAALPFAAAWFGAMTLLTSPLNFTAGATFALGTTDSQQLDIKTGGTVRWSVSTGGNLFAGAGAGILATKASDTTICGLRLPHGTAPTSPQNGDIWTTTAGLFVRINGSTIGPLT